VIPASIGTGTPRRRDQGYSPVEIDVPAMYRLAAQVQELRRVDMAYEQLIYEIPEDGVARITFDRPDQLNAMSTDLIREIHEAADEAATDRDIAVLIYRGAGKAFSVGRDFKESAKLQTESSEGWYAFRRRHSGFSKESWLYPKATIAAVHGYALGIGNNLALGCDITLASEDARFGLPEARYGLLHGGSSIWNWLMGPKRTKEYMFTGRNISAQDAYDFGLVNHVVPNDKLEEETLLMARDIVQIERRNPGYIFLNKAQINERHGDMMIHCASCSPDIVGRAGLEAAFREQTMKSQVAFYEDVAARGISAALDRMHSGFTTRK
jgi:enoyl-CoA hydratase/carnithine racemase